MAFANKLLETRNPAAMKLLTTVIKGLSHLDDADFSLVSKRTQTGEGNEQYSIVITALGDGETLNAHYKALEAALKRIAPSHKGKPEHGSLSELSLIPAPGVGELSLNAESANHLLRGLNALGDRVNQLEGELSNESLIYARAQASTARNTIQL